MFGTTDLSWKIIGDWVCFTPMRFLGDLMTSVVILQEVANDHSDHQGELNDWKQLLSKLWKKNSALPDSNKSVQIKPELLNT